MLFSHPQIGLVLVLIVCGISCNVPLDKKCVKGYLYDHDLHVCLPDGDDEETDTDTDKEDGGVVDVDGGCLEPGSFSGVNESCKEQFQCEDYDADFCLVDPLSGEGGCVLTGCDKSACPCGYSCCDCSSIGLPIFCVPEEVVTEMESYTCQCS